jgi:hypothetical protein
MPGLHQAVLLDTYFVQSAMCMARFMRERKRERGRAAESSLFLIGVCGLWLVDKPNWTAEFVFWNAAFQLFDRKTTFR